MRVLKPNAFDKAAMMLVDVRSPGEYRAAHAAGAVNVPLEGFDVRSLPEGRSVALICKTGARAARAAEKCVAAGQDQVAVIEGGTEAWDAAGLAMVRGQRRLPMERQVLVGAGAMVLVGFMLAWAVHPAFLALSVFVGAGLFFAGLTGFCGMALVLAKMPWNR